MIQTLKKILAPITVSLETKAVWIREDKIESLRSVTVINLSGKANNVADALVSVG